MVGGNQIGNEIRLVRPAFVREERKGGGKLVTEIGSTMAKALLLGFCQKHAVVMRRFAEPAPHSVLKHFMGIADVMPARSPKYRLLQQSAPRRERGRATRNFSRDLASVP